MIKELVIDLGKSNELTYDLKTSNQLTFDLSKQNIITIIFEKVIREVFLQLYEEYKLKHEYEFDVGVMQFLEIKIEEAFKVFMTSLLESVLADSIRVQIEDHETVDYDSFDPEVITLSSIGNITIKEEDQLDHMIDCVMTLVKKIVEPYFDELAEEVIEKSSIDARVSDNLVVDITAVNHSILSDSSMTMDMNELISILFEQHNTITDDCDIEMSYYMVSNHSLDEIDEEYLGDLDDLNLNQV